MDVLEVFRRAMSKAAVRLRAQKAYSTDPEYLERMAVEEEARHPAGIGDEDVAAPPLLTGQSARPRT